VKGLPGITVLDVMRAMKVEITPAISWSVGARVREAYRTRIGMDPPKALRTKTGGGGSHCFAVYPEDMREEIERIVRSHDAQTATQGSLF
jgi:hypothetical protein